MEIINSSNFKEKIASGVTIVDFYADWCGPCQVLGALLDPVSEQRSEDFYKLNVDENTDVASESGVMGLPTLVIYKDGVEQERITGVPDISVITDALDKLA